MKLVNVDDQAVIFQLSTRERDVMIQILQSYPVVLPAHQPVSKELNDPQVTEYQRLLDEALVEQRTTNKLHLQTWLATPERFKKTKAGYRFTLERADFEWLLQVLNDIRVGHWLLLGSPRDTGIIPPDVAPSLMPRWMAMHLSGYFQMVILEGLET